jgi:hypothetical protein
MARVAGNSRTYDFYLNGKKNLGVLRLPSVTTILDDVLGASQWLVPWAYKLGLDGGESPDEFKNRRAAEGSATHEWVEAWIEQDGGLEPTSGYEKAWVKFVKDHDPEIFLSENVILSQEHFYAGTLDLGIRKLDGSPRIIDLKTKKKTIYKAYNKELIQARAYEVAAYEMGLFSEHADTAILILKPNGLYTYDERSVSADLWLNVLSLHKMMKREGFIK